MFHGLEPFHAAQPPPPTGRAIFILMSHGVTPRLPFLASRKQIIFYIGVAQQASLMLTSLGYERGSRSRHDRSVPFFGPYVFLLLRLPMLAGHKLGKIVPRHRRRHPPCM